MLTLREEAYCLESMTRVGIGNREQRKTILKMVDEQLTELENKSEKIPAKGE